MRIGKRALEATNPGAEYIVLTDAETAPYLAKEFTTVVTAPSNTPLMLQFLIAQLDYCRFVDKGGLSVLAGTDCVASKPIENAIDTAHDVVITYRMGGRCNINNVAYVRNHEKMVWFLRRALGFMNPNLVDFFGDQEAWAAALGPVENWVPIDSEARSICKRVVSVDGRKIWLYPCKIFNNAPKRSGAFGSGASKAYLVHYKGTRKDIMVESVRWNILGESDTGVQPRWGK